MSHWSLDLQTWDNSESAAAMAKTKECQVRTMFESLAQGVKALE